MTRLLITGGFGFIGSHTIVALQAAGFGDLVVVDDLRRSDPAMVRGVAALLGMVPVHESVDVTDLEALSGVFATHGPFDAVIHFAAYKSVRESVLHPLRYYRNNVLGIVALLEAMAASTCTRLVFSSSCTVYGHAATLPVSELTPLRPAMSPYGATKQICEQIIADSIAPVGGGAGSLTHALSLRYFNPAGAHASAHIGELPIGVPDNLVPFITQTAAGWRDRLSVFGSDYDTPDGTPVRDYLHIVDVANAHVAAVGHVLSGPAGNEVVNLGSGVGHTVLEVLRAFEETTGLTVPYVLAPRRSGDVEQIWSSCEKAEALLGWRAGLGLPEIMASAWAWQQTLPRPVTGAAPSVTGR